MSKSYILVLINGYYTPRTNPLRSRKESLDKRLVEGIKGNNRLGNTVTLGGVTR